MKLKYFKPFRIINMHFLITLVTIAIFSSIARADNNPCIMKWGIAEEYGFALQVTGGTPYTKQDLSPPVGTILRPSPADSYGYIIFNSFSYSVSSILFRIQSSKYFCLFLKLPKVSY